MEQDVTEIEKKDRDKIVKLLDEGRKEDAIEYIFQTLNIGLESMRLEAQLESDKDEKGTR